MARAPVHVLVDEIIKRFVDTMLRMAREHLVAELRGFTPPQPIKGPVTGRAERNVTKAAPPKSTAGSKARRPTGPHRREPPRSESAFGAPAKVVGPVHAQDHVERMIELVRNHPWPPRSRELQFLLGVKKDPFLRIADLALASGRVRREGRKAGVQYFYVGGAG